MTDVLLKSSTGRLIVFEGPDGVGKSTLSAAAAERLRVAGYPCELLTFPGREPGSLGKLVYDLHHAPETFGVRAPTPSATQALHVAAHLDAIERRIRPLLATGTHVLMDRFWWSTWVYGAVGGMDRQVLTLLIEVERAFWSDLLPAVAILVRRGQPLNRADEQLDHWRKLSVEYGELSQREASAHPVEVIENEGSLDDAIARTTRICETALNSRPGDGTATDPEEGNPPPAPAAMQLDMAFVRGVGRSSARGPRQDAPQQPRRRDGSNRVDGGMAEAPNSAAPPAGAGYVTPTVLTHLLPAKPTLVFDTYWRFAAERQQIFFRRAAAAPHPWTRDPVLAAFKFTNAYRASDRVSQYLIRRVIYRDDLPSTPVEVFFRIILFKVFNKIQTWELLERELGSVTYEGYTFDRYDAALSAAMAAGRPVYSAAYIMPTGGRGAGETRKHRMHLRLIERMMGDELPKKLADAPSMHRAFDLLVAYPTIGDFLAYQFVTDVNYSTITDFSEMDFVVPGPGARDGIRKCFTDAGGLGESEVIKLMADRQEREFERLGLTFRSLFGRPLQLIDCQNLFCEVDKYARVAHPEVMGRSGRTRIKQRFAYNEHPIEYWYPPKWKLNDRAAREVGGPPSAVEALPPGLLPFAGSRRAAGSS